VYDLSKIKPMKPHTVSVEHKLYFVDTTVSLICLVFRTQKEESPYERRLFCHVTSVVVLFDSNYLSTACL